MKNQIFKNLATNYFGNFIGMAMGFLVVPFLIAKLGKELFGVIVLAESVVAFLQIFAFSIRIALSRYATLALAREDTEGFAEYLSTGRYVLLVCAFFVFCFGVMLSYFFPNIFSVPHQYANQTKILFFLISMSFVITIPNAVFWSVVYAKNRFDLINISNFGGIILRTILIVLLFTILPPHANYLVCYGFIYLAMTWAQNFFIYLWHKRLMPHLVIKTKLYRNKLKELLSYAGYSTTGNISAMLAENVMNVVVNLFWGPAGNAVYSISQKIPSIFKRLFIEPSWSLVPTMTDFIGKGQREKIKELFCFYTKVINILIIPVGVFIVMLSHQIILTWVGPDFKIAAETMPLFLIAALMSIPASVCLALINAYGKIGFPTMISLVFSILNIALGILLGFKLGLGLWGVGMAAVIINFFSAIFFLPIYACRIADISFKKYFMDITLKPVFLTIIILYLPLLKLRAVSGHLTLLVVALGAVLIVVNYLLALMLFLTTEEKRHARQFIQKLLGKLNRVLVLFQS